jgi:Ca-activated chloride channel family protein
MTWAWPPAWWLLPLVILVWPLWYYREQGRPSLRHPDLRFLPASESSRRLTLARWWPLLGRLLTALCVWLALLGPRWPVPGTALPSEGIALIFVLDVSGSMGEADVLLEGKPVTRLQAAVTVIKQFLASSEERAARGNDAIGLVTFAARPHDVCPPTLTHGSVTFFLDQAKPIGTVPDSSTNIGDALGVAVDLLHRSEPRSRAVILISDGEHTVPAELDKDALKPRQAAQLAAALGIRVHTIFLSGAPGNEPARLAEQQRAEATLKSVSQMTQGVASLASDGKSLAQVGRELDSMEKSQITSFVYAEYTETRGWFLVAALVLLVLTIVLEETWLRISP